MATSPLASTSVGTIDVQSLVSQLMTIERQPIDNLNTQVSSYQSKISSFGTISSLVSSFQSSLQSVNSSLLGFSSASSDTSIFSAAADSTASPGTYSINVSTLAQAQSLVATGKTDTTSPIGNGTATTVTFDFGTISGGTISAGVYSNASFTSNGGGTKSITIDSSNNTLQGIRDAINAANMGLTATIVNDGSGTPYRLVLSSNNTGITNSLKISTSGGDGTVNALLAYDPAGTQNLTQTVAAQNANLKVNGIAISKASNTITDAIQGVSLTLNNISSNSSTTSTLTVSHDTSGIQSAVSGFVDAYNALSNQLATRSAYGDATTPGGALAGDGTIRLIQNQLRDIFNTAAKGGTLAYLAQAGVSFQTDGTLKLDSNALNNAMSNNFSDVVNLFSSATGFATRLNTWASSVLDPSSGLIAIRTKSLNTSIQGYNDQITRLQSRMAILQQQYTAQYSNLNMLLTSMNNTSSYLTQQFAKGTSTG